MRSPFRLVLLISVVALCAPAGCASTSSAGPVTYGETARSNYEKGMRELKDATPDGYFKYQAVPAESRA